MKLDDYIRDRRARDKAFDEGYDEGRARFMLSQAIALARKDAGLTQAALAARTGVTVWTVSKVERRVEYATPEELARVCCALAPWLRVYGYTWAEPPIKKESRRRHALPALELVHA